MRRLSFPKTGGSRVCALVANCCDPCEEEFWKLGEEYFRRNEIWRSVYERASGVHRYDEKIKSNFALVRYAVE